MTNYLWCFIKGQPKEWVKWAEFWFNTTFHKSTSATPLEVVYGRQPPKIVQVIEGEIRVEAIQRELMDRDEAFGQLKKHLLRAQD